MRVIWTPEAVQDRIDVWEYIAADNPHAAIQMDDLFSNAAARLGEHPKLGRAGKIQGTRELIPHENYRLVYEIDADTIWILVLVHTARLWPPTRELRGPRKPGAATHPASRGKRRSPRSNECARVRPRYSTNARRLCRSRRDSAAQKQHPRSCGARLQTGANDAHLNPARYSRTHSRRARWRQNPPPPRSPPAAPARSPVARCAPAAAG